MIFKRSDLIVHATMFFLVCFAHESSKNAHTISEPVVDKTEIEDVLSTDDQALDNQLAIEELPFISSIELKLTSNPNHIVLPRINRP